MGDLEISTLDENGRQSSIKLTNVRLAPDVDIALISVSQLIGANFEVMLGTPPHLRSPSGDTLPLHIDVQGTASTTPPINGNAKSCFCP